MFRTVVSASIRCVLFLSFGKRPFSRPAGSVAFPTCASKIRSSEFAIAGRLGQVEIYADMSGYVQLTFVKIGTD